jgi:hypothetical protein
VRQPAAVEKEPVVLPQVVPAVEERMLQSVVALQPLTLRVVKPVTPVRLCARRRRQCEHAGDRYGEDWQWGRHDALLSTPPSGYVPLDRRSAPVFIFVLPDEAHAGR